MHWVNILHFSQTTEKIQTYLIILQADPVNTVLLTSILRSVISYVLVNSLRSWDRKKCIFNYIETRKANLNLSEVSFRNVSIFQKFTLLLDSTDWKKFGGPDCLIYFPADCRKYQSLKAYNPYTSFGEFIFWCLRRVESIWIFLQDFVLLFQSNTKTLSPDIFLDASSVNSNCCFGGVENRIFRTCGVNWSPGRSWITD